MMDDTPIAPDNAPSFAEIRALQAETHAQIKELNAMYGGVSKSLGLVAEEFFYNCLQARPRLHGMHFDEVYANVVGFHHGAKYEYDIVLENGEAVFVIEVKHKARQADLDKLLTGQKPEFGNCFPQYREFAQYFGLATFYLYDDLKARALDEGITVLQRKGDVIETFTP